MDKVTKASRKIQKVEDDDEIDNRTAQNWFNYLKGGDLYRQIKPKSRKSSVVDPKDLQEKVELNLASSTRKLSEEPGPLKDTTWCLIQASGNDSLNFGQAVVVISKHLLT